MEYVRFLDVAVLPREDIILIDDSTFVLRPMQTNFLRTANVQFLQNISLSANVWLELREVHYRFPTATKSPASIFHELPALKRFYLALRYRDELPPFDLSLGDHDAEWIEGALQETYRCEDEAFAMRETTENHKQRQRLQKERMHIQTERVRMGRTSRRRLERIHHLPVLEQNSDGTLTENGKLDELLRHQEQQAFLWKELKESKLGQGPKRYVGLNSPPKASQGLYTSEVQEVFDIEMASTPDWKPPAICIRELKHNRKGNFSFTG